MLYHIFSSRSCKYNSYQIWLQQKDRVLIKLKVLEIGATLKYKIIVTYILKAMELIKKIKKIKIKKNWRKQHSNKTKNNKTFIVYSNKSNNKRIINNYKI
jgi:ligand-binding SRPBCC domain-containing protein